MGLDEGQGRSGPGLSRSAVGRGQAVEPPAVVPENLLLGRLAQVGARTKIASGKGLPIAVRHVRAQDDVVVANQVDDLRQEQVLALSVDVDLSALEILER